MNSLGLLIERHSHIDHILRDRRQHSGILDVRANFDTDHLSGSCKSYEDTIVSKQAIKSDMRSFGPKKLNEVEGKEQY
jgi:hypothetical protein